MAAPTITISCVIPGTSTPANTGTVEFNWSVTDTPPDAATAVSMGISSPSLEVFPEGTATDWGGSHSSIFPTTSGSFLVDIERTHAIEIYASNADGSSMDWESLYAKIPVGYHDATIAGSPVNQRDLDLVRGYLEEVEGKLRTDVLTNLPNYIEEYNSLVPEEHHFPDFADMEYLSAAVGSGGLADDILDAMRGVLIYIDPYAMPRGWRPGTITVEDRKALCEGDAVYGKSTRNWISLCLKIGAADMTLLHELFHHASNSNYESEARAFAVSMCADNWFPDVEG